MPDSLIAWSSYSRRLFNAQWWCYGSYCYFGSASNSHSDFGGCDSGGSVKKEQKAIRVSSVQYCYVLLHIRNRL